MREREDALDGRGDLRVRMVMASSLGTRAEAMRISFLPALNLKRELLTLPGLRSSSNSKVSSLLSRNASSRRGGSLSMESFKGEILLKEARSLPSVSSAVPED